MAWLRYWLMCLLIVVASCSVSAQKLELGTRSVYKDGAFHTRVAYVVDAPITKLNSVVHEVYVGFQGKPTTDLKWLWKNLGHHDNVENDLVMSEKGFYLNPETNDYLLKMGLAMKKEDKPTIYNIQGKLSETASGQTRHFLLTVTKKIKILNHAAISLKSYPLKGGKSAVLLESEMAFGWFFSMFFSENRYRSIMEWRIQGLAMNVKKRAEGDTSPNY